MKRLLFITLLLLLITTGCSNDDDSNTPAMSEINGKWNLINVTGGFAGVDQDFEKGTITWTFNESTKMVTVANNTTITGVYTGLDSGTYPYSISPFPNSNVSALIVNENSLGTLTIEGSTMIATEEPRDGFKITFER